MKELALTSEAKDDAFDYFSKWAREFKENPPEQRYGILPIGKSYHLDNMIYTRDSSDLLFQVFYYAYEDGLSAEQILFENQKLEALSFVYSITE